MAEQMTNALVLNGVNDDITELKSLTTLRKRLVSDGEIVSKAANGFRLASSNTGVILRNDDKDFYVLATANGQAQDGQWNTLRPFSFSLNTGRVSLRNGVDVSGGAFISHNAGITAQTTGPDPLINGQTYRVPVGPAAPSHTGNSTQVAVIEVARAKMHKLNSEMGLYK